MAENIFDRKTEFGKSFFCRNGMIFSSIRDLMDALPELAENQKEEFYYHVTGEKNDFASWIEHIFLLGELAEKMRKVNSPWETLKVLSGYESELMEISVAKKRKKPEEENYQKDETVQKNENKDILKEVQETQKAQENKENNDALKDEIEQRLERSDQEFDRVKKIKKHSFYNKSDFDNTTEGLRDKYDELQRSISEHRKEGKNMSIPDMLLRNIHPKISYFQVSQNNKDYEKILQLFDEVEQEIKYASNIQEPNLKQEILEAAGMIGKKEEG